MRNDRIKYRSRPDIIAALNAGRDGAIKTQLSHRAFLPHNRLCEYLDYLLSHGLLEYVPEKNRYYTTEKGLRYLEMYGKAGWLLLLFPRVATK